MLTFKTIPCNCCGGSRLREVYADELNDRAPTVDYAFSTDTRLTFRIVQCLDCGLMFTNPVPDLSSAYEENVDAVYLTSVPERRHTAARAIALVRRFKPSGHLLDVGCASGVFLDAAAPYFTTEGIELSRWARDIAARRHAVSDRPLADQEGKDRYDVVTLWGVIEHFADPKGELAAAARLLKPGGVLAIYTGDCEAWLPRLLGKRWWWFQGMHLYYFSNCTLARMLRDVGCEVIKTTGYTVFFSPRSLANSLNRYSWARLFRPVLSLKWIQGIYIPLRLSGEMVMVARKIG